MKKIVGLFIVLAVFLTACGETAKIKEVKSTDIMQKMDNKESFVLEIASDSCSACIAFKPTLEEMIKNKKVEVFKVTLDRENVQADGKTANPDGHANVAKLLEQYLEGQVSSTPTMVIVKDGKVSSVLVGAVQYTALVKWLVDNEIIKN